MRQTSLLDRLLAPLRHEASMFHLLLAVAALAAAVIAVVLLVRAVT